LRYCYELSKLEKQKILPSIMGITINNSEVNLSSLVSPRKDKDKPIYRWHSFKHSYSKELVDTFINEFHLDNKSRVIDPFVGGGTTLLACKEKNINAIGIDILPFSIFLTKTKLQEYNKDELNRVFNLLQSKIESNNVNNYEMPDIPLIKKAFRQEIWNEVLFIKNQILTIKSKIYKDFFLLALLSILESVSNTTKAGGFLRITKRRIKKGLVKRRFYDYASFMINDIPSKNNNRKIKLNIKALKGDARKLNISEKFDAVITSPPYPNRHDYTRIYALELIANFINCNDELKKLRYKTLRSHVEARELYSSNGYKKPKELIAIIKKIETNGTNNPQIIGMIEGYFEDMYLAIKEMKKVLKKDGEIALVVSNVRFSGINIPVDEILGKIGENVGLQLKEIRVARLRGNSSQQMRNYKKSLSRESIIIWENKSN
jgi:DNA modification methylase